jgi:hypothetical protein
VLTVRAGEAVGLQRIALAARSISIPGAQSSLGAFRALSVFSVVQL